MKKTLTPIVLGISIILAIIALVALTSFDCIHYAR